MKLKDFEFKFDVGGEDGAFTGYGSVFGNVDSDNEIVAPGAFTDSLKQWAARKSMPKLLWQHSTRQPIGIYKSMTEDGTGLRVEGQLLVKDVQLAREAYALMKAGAVDGLSIGYDCPADGYSIDRQSGVGTIKQANLYEVSVVTFPANDQARINTVKSSLMRGDLPSLPEFEKFLREAGFSNTQAKAIAGKGLSHLLQREAGGTRGESLADVLANLRKS